LCKQVFIRGRLNDAIYIFAIYHELSNQMSNFKFIEMTATLLKFFKADLISKFSNKVSQQIPVTDNYCYLVFSFNNLNEPKIFLNHIGDDVLENISITIQDTEKINDINHLQSMDEAAYTKKYKKCSYQYHFKIIYPYDIYPTLPLLLDKNKNNISLTVDIQIENRILRQTIFIENYKCPYRIINNKVEENGNVILQLETGVKKE